MYDEIKKNEKIFRDYFYVFRSIEISAPISIHEKHTECLAYISLYPFKLIQCHESQSTIFECSHTNFVFPRTNDKSYLIKVRHIDIQIRILKILVFNFVSSGVSKICKYLQFSSNDVSEKIIFYTLCPLKFVVT